MKIHAYRSTMPFDNRSSLYGPSGGPFISPPTSKSVIPTNNVPTILDILGGEVSIQDIYPHTRGNWAPGEDVDKSYKEQGDDYKRVQRDLDILNQMTAGPSQEEKWKVKVPGGSKIFPSFELAQKYKEKLRGKGIPYSYLTRIAQNSKEKDRVELIADSLNKTFMVESINTEAGVKENGAAFCVYPNYFITCAHVVKKYDKYNLQNVDFNSGVMISLINGVERHSVTVVSVDPVLDLALLKSDINVEPLQLDKSVSIGEDVITIGSPHGYENNVSVGTVGSLHRKVYFYKGAPAYTFVDLAIYPGNSGGPVIKESNGKVIGMVTLIVSTEGEYGLNACLPSNYIAGFCEFNIEGFRVRKE